MEDTCKEKMNFELRKKITNPNHQCKKLNHSGQKILIHFNFLLSNNARNIF